MKLRATAWSIRRGCLNPLQEVGVMKPSCRFASEGHFRLNPLQEVGVMKQKKGRDRGEKVRLNPLQEVGVMKL